jgi:threonine/homoserine/homoserine lactone efflux protein
MEFNPFLRGIAIGFWFAAPVGPIGLLCIRRTLTRGTFGGLFVGLSGAAADVVYALVAQFSVLLVLNFIETYETSIRIIGGILLIVMGIVTARTHPHEEMRTNGTSGHLREFISTFILALTNPMILFAFIAAFSSFGPKLLGGSPLGSTLLVFGVFVGSILWFSFLTGVSRIFKASVTTNGLIIINRVVGVLLALFGVGGIFVGLGWITL